MFLRLLTAVMFVAAHLAISARVQDRATATTTVAPQAAPAATPKSPRIASYRIDARLDPSTRTISGDEVVTWRNTTANAVATLQFHLYYNAWRNAESTWMREHRLTGDTRLMQRPEQEWARLDLSAVRVVRGSAEIDLLPHVRFIAPDDGNTEDRTVAELTVDRPVQPGETLSVRMLWSSRVPRTFSRTGVIGNYYFIAQWFPKIGVLEDGGWNCHQFHASTEFFADFGTYDVRLTVPKDWVVGATGIERERRDNPDGTATHRYYQDDVHDFAWTTSPDYVVLTDTFTHSSLPSVNIRLLLQPEHRGQEQRHFDATRAALKYYGEWFGAYPYGHLTVIDPAWQSDAGGMEYPTLITAGTNWLAPPRATQPESVTIHETGHQYWYGIVATNEFEHAWMDEGLNTFSTARVLAQTFDPNFHVRRYFGGYIPWTFPALVISRDAETRAAITYRPSERGDMQSGPSWSYWPGSGRGVTYSKTALWLHTLERMLGWDTLQRVLSAYFSKWAFRHPQPEDFFAVANEVSGRDLTWFFDEVYRSSNAFDYGVDVFRSDPIPSDAGAGGAGSRRYRTTVVARRYGEGIFPIDVRVVLENDEEVRWRWDGRDRWKLFTVDRAVAARRADVDPDGVLLLDVKRTNNSALRKTAAPRAARKWSLVWLIWLQDHLLTYGFFV